MAIIVEAAGRIRPRGPTPTAVTFTVRRNLRQHTGDSTREDHPMETDKLLQAEIRVINIGLRQFAHDLRSCKVPVVHVDWSPPAVTDPRIASLLAKLGG